jgi:hypothetical protein
MSTREDFTMSTALEAAVAAAKLAIGPGATNGQVAERLPEHMRQPFWQRAIQRVVDAEPAPPRTEQED